MTALAGAKAREGERIGMRQSIGSTAERLCDPAFDPK
jgi:hypothetical protein